MIWILILCLFGLKIKKICSIGHSLNAATVLLPILSPESDPAIFDIHIYGEGGCFKVSNNRPDVINTINLETFTNSRDGSVCLQSIRIFPSTRVKNRDNAVLTFIDQLSGLILAAHIVVDKIFRLKIHSHRRVLYLGDNKEKFEIIAYDSLGNVFNSLTGPAFDTKIICDRGCHAQNPASLANFQSSHFEVPEQILKLEERGMRGNIVLVESISKGDVRLTVKLTDKLYDNISDSITISIREYISIAPAETQYLLIGGYYPFKFYRHVRSAPQEIKFDPKLYNFTTSNPKSTEIINYKNIHAVALGESLVSFHEIGSSFNPDLDAFTVSLIVVNPTHAHAQCETQENWILELNTPYIINLTIFYMTHKINISNFVFHANLTITKNIIKINKISSSGLIFEFLPAQVGITEISFLVTSFDTEIEKNIPLNTPLSTTLQIEIVEPINISPKLMVIPLSNPLIKHSYRFLGSGGSGRYVWGSLIPLFHDNLDSAFSGAPEGLHEIFIHDRMTKFIKNKAQLLSLAVKNIKISVSFLEIPINTNFYLNISLIGYDSFLHKSDIEFTHFSLKFLKLEFSDSNFHFCSEPFFDYSYCLISSKPGCNEIKISLSNSTYNISSNIRLCSFEHLKISSAHAVTIPGSFIILNISGGPSSILPNKNKFDISVNQSDIFSLFSTNFLDKENRVELFKFQCLKPGKETLYFTSHNSNSLPLAYLDKAEYFLECIAPKDIKFTVHPYNNDINCSNKVYFLSQSKNNIKFSVFVYNKILIEDLSEFTAQISSFPESFLKNSVAIASLIKSNSDHIISSGEVSIVPTETIGDAKIIIDLKPKINEEYSFSVSFDVRAVHQHSIPYKKITILYYEENRRKFLISGGSGIFKVVKNSNIVSVSKSDLSLEIYPKRLGFETLQINDICCNFPPHTLDISVTTISRVNVVYPIKDRVNSSTKVEILVYTDLDQLVSNEEQNLISIDFKFFGNRPDEIIKSLNTPSGHAIYYFYSFRPIVIDFVVEVTLIKNKTIVSKKCQIEIFKDVQIVPGEINMIPGQEIQLRTEGGPQINIESRYRVSGNCAEFIKSNNSLISKSLCVETVSVEVFGIDSDFKEISYSKFQVSLTISDVKRIEIFSINNKFYQETHVPAGIKIFNSHGLITQYISISNKYIIEWNVEKSNHISLKFFRQNGIDDRVLMFMDEEGSSNIYCKFKYLESGSLNPKIFTTSKLIYVIRPLNIFSCQQRVILPPNIKYDLKEIFLNSFVTFKFAESNHPGFNLDSSGLLTVPGYPSHSLIIADVKDSRQDIQHSEVVTFIVEVSEISEMFLTPVNYSLDSYLGLDKIRVGAEINLHLRAIDQFGRVFQTIPSSFANITLNPLGIVEVIDFKESVLTIKGVNLGIAYLSLNTHKNTHTNLMSLTVSNPFSSQFFSLVVGEILMYTLTNSDLSWKFSNAEILTYSLNDNKIYILSMDIGESDLNVQYKSSYYSVLKLKISPPFSVEFSKSISVVSTKIKNYYLDIVINEDFTHKNYNVSFDHYPFTCLFSSNINHPYKISEGINPETGFLCCILTTKNQDSYPGDSFDFSLNVEFKINNQENKYLAVKKLNYVPPLSSQKFAKTPISVNKCIFEDITLKTNGVIDDLLITSDIECMEIGSYVNKNSKLTVMSLKLSKCLEKIKSDIRGNIIVSRESTNDKIEIPIVVKYDDISCLHGPIVSSGILFNLLVLLVCILISWIIFDRMKIIYMFFYDIFMKFRILFDISQRTFVGPSNVNQIPPKACSLKKSDSSVEDGSFSRELYTTRKEYLNSSYKL